MGIELQTELAQGERVLITIKNLEPFFGTVAWSKKPRAGLAFDELIAPSLLTNKNGWQVEGDGISNKPDGYHVFDRFKPVSDMKRPAVKPRK